MPETMAPEPAPAEARGLVGRLTGVLLAPRATYADVAASPKVFGVLLVVVLIMAGLTMTFFSTEVGRQALLDQQVRSMESFGRQVTDQQYTRLQQMSKYSGYMAAAGQVVTMPLMGLVVAGLLFAVFTAAMGGKGTFKQVYAVVAHSAVVFALQQCFTLPIAYAKESISSPTNLAVFLPFLDEASFAARALGAIDLFLIWWVVSLSIGLGVLYKKRTGPIAVTLLVIYAGIAVVVAAVKTALAGA